MLILCFIMFLLAVGATIAFRLLEGKKLFQYICLGGAILFVILFGVFGCLAGRKLFEADDQKLGGWIFIVLALLVAHVQTFMITYKINIHVSRIALGVAFVLGILFIIMCIYEAKASFATGIGSNSPGYSSSSLTALIPYFLYIV